MIFLYIVGFFITPVGNGFIIAYSKWHNDKDVIINGAILDLKTGNVVVSYKEATKWLTKIELDTLDVPLINVTKAGKGLTYVEFGGGTKWFVEWPKESLIEASFSRL